MGGGFGGAGDAGWDPPGTETRFPDIEESVVVEPDAVGSEAGNVDWAGSFGDLMGESKEWSTMTNTAVTVTPPRRAPTSGEIPLTNLSTDLVLFFLRPTAVPPTFQFRSPKVQTSNLDEETAEGVFHIRPTSDDQLAAQKNPTGRRGRRTPEPRGKRFVEP